jgi:hypothetical protein
MPLKIMKNPLILSTSQRITSLQEAKDCKVNVYQAGALTFFSPSLLMKPNGVQFCSKVRAMALNDA